MFARVVALLTALSIVAQGWTAPGADAAPERADRTLPSGPGRSFDFMFGEWDVTLLRSNGKGGFEESPAGTASVYSILGGKAILELARTGPAPRLAIRYRDPSAERWVQWLARPERTGARLKRSEGGFRHGRGELRRTVPDAEGRTVLTSETFSDITAVSFRWDEAKSGDLGKSWEYHWVMEFTRASEEPKHPVWMYLPAMSDDQTLCDEERFRQHELLVGKWRGEAGRLDVASVLDRCAVFGMLELTDGGRELVFLTYDGVEKHWVTGVLDDAPGTGLLLYSGSTRWFDLVSEDGEPLTWTVWVRSPGTLEEAGASLSYQRGKRDLRFQRVEDQKR